jgi:hypothetical protein
VPRVGARLSVTLADASGTPITDAIVKVSALPTARTSGMVESTLRPDSTGYNAILGVARAGQWEFRFEVTRGGEHFTQTVQLDAVPFTPGL